MWATLVLAATCTAVVGFTACFFTLVVRGVYLRLGVRSPTLEFHLYRLLVFAILPFVFNTSACGGPLRMSYFGSGI